MDNKKITTNSLIEDYKKNNKLISEYKFVENVLNIYNKELLILEEYNKNLDKHLNFLDERKNKLIKLINNNPKDFVDGIEIEKVVCPRDDSDDRIIFVNKEKNKYVVKISSNFHILHQGLVSLLVINKLSEEIPTFVFTYGFININIFEDNEEKESDNNIRYKFQKYNIEDIEEESEEDSEEESEEESEEDSESKCAERKYKALYRDMMHKNKNIGLVIENIEGKMLEDLLGGGLLDEVDIYNLILIVLHSLYYANERYKFVHWDLHCGNIIMREYKKGYIKIGDKYFITPKNYIPTIFDFELSTIYYNNNKYGNEQFPELGINNDTNIIVDYIKFLYSVLKYNKNSKVEKVLIRILGLVIEEPIEAKKKVFDRTCLIIPNSREIIYKTEDFLDDVRRIFKTIGYYTLINPPEEEIIDYM
jgi:hypothetical protein